MKLITFTYTKVNGDVSEREVVEVAQPSKLLAAIDVTEMDSGDFAEFALKYKDLLDRQKLERLELLCGFDLKNNYRQFKPELMTNVETEHV